ncbi:Hypothetical_protein [Hexamita inflata]|uniref:Hypothetical_protein n=1 Tax=Hexamita inflata TaxID=28002 RepID=A0ABP1J6K5_9EUKA
MSKTDVIELVYVISSEFALLQMIYVITRLSNQIQFASYILLLHSFQPYMQRVTFMGSTVFFVVQLYFQIRRILIQRYIRSLELLHKHEENQLQIKHSDFLQVQHTINLMHYHIKHFQLLMIHNEELRLQCQLQRHDVLEAFLNRKEQQKHRCILTYSKYVCQMFHVLDGSCSAWQFTIMKLQKCSNSWIVKLKQSQVEQSNIFQKLFRLVVQS